MPAPLAALSAITAAWYVGLCLGPAWPEAPRALLGTSALALATLVWLRPGRLRAVLPAAAALAALAVAPPADPRPLGAGVATLEARVVSAKTRAGRPGSVLELVDGRTIEGGEPVGRGRVWSDEALPTGARVRMLARISPRGEFHNPSPHPEWPSPDRLRGRARRVPGVPAKVLSRDAARDRLEAARTATRRALDGTLPTDVSAIARALVLGEGGALPNPARAAVRAAGLSHLLAVSGLHISLLLALLVYGARKLAAPFASDAGRAAAALGLCSGPLLAAFAGGAPSAQRAALTAMLALGARLSRRRPSSGAVAALAVLALTLVEPRSARSPGLLLSVVATAAILGGAPGEGLRGAARTSARALLATLPFSVYVFGQSSPLAFFVNVLLLPVFGFVLVPLSWLHALLALTAPWASAWSGACLTSAARALLAACVAVARHGPTTSLPPISLAQGVALGAGCLALLLARRWRVRLALACALLLLLGLLEWRLRVREQPVGELRATFLDIGQGDGALVDLPDGRLMMVDAGPRAGSAPERVLLPLLAARRRRRVDIFVLSHGHPDHYGGLESLLDAGVPITELWVNRQPEEEEGTQGVALLLRRARNAGTRIRYPAELCGRPRLFAGASALLLAPCPGYDSGFDLNDNSLILRLQYGGRRLLFTGDVEALGEDVLTRLGHALYADVLKVPHHGSRTSSTARLLQLVRPRWAVVSCGRDNAFGHPHAEALRRLRASAAYTLRTDRLGGVVIETDGSALTVQPTEPWPLLRAQSPESPSLHPAAAVLEHGVDLRGPRGAVHGAAQGEAGDAVGAARVVEGGVAGAAR